MHFLRNANDETTARSSLANINRETTIGAENHRRETTARDHSQLI